MENCYRQIKVEKLNKKQTVYTYLKSFGYSENYLKNLRKKKGYIIVNNEVCFMNRVLNCGDVLQIHNNPNTKSCISYCDIPLDIVYEDNDVLAINKPSGLATMPSRSHYSNNLAGGILNYYKNKNFVVRIVNRLDKDASGIVLVAKNSLASNFLNNQENVKKTYYALVCGSIKDNLIIEKNILTLNNNGINENKRIVSDTLGKPAKTEVYLIKNFDNYCLVKINITHGRTHQIRVHLSSVNHSLLGDELYGQKSHLISHTALHLKQVSFVHPLTKEIINLEVDFPQDFKKLISQEQG